MDKRYQVFVSSTYSGLEKERKAVIENLLNAKFIPAGMEMFSASNDEQFKYIKKILDTCDYYVLIVAARYGSINPTTGISYTEQEYDYAVEQGIPILAFLHSDPYNLPAELREDDKRKELDAFRAKVSKERLCKMWSNIDQLAAPVVISLIAEAENNPRLGWTRGPVVDSTDLLVQINELRREKEEYEEQIRALKEQIGGGQPQIPNLASGQHTYVIGGELYSDYEETTTDDTVELTWDQIFSAIGAFLFLDVTYDEFRANLLTGINSAHHLPFLSFNEDCVQTIKIQLCALGLINIVPKEAEKRGMVESIKLTEYGKNYLIQIKAKKTSKKATDNPWQSLTESDTIFPVATK